jgi:hypothetical protein
MDRDRWAKKEVKVAGTHNIVVKIQFISRDYNDPVVVESAKALENGRLELMRLEPKRSDWPEFSVRWDQSAGSIDIDLRGGHAREFALRRPGHRGHRTERVSDSPRIFVIDIETPGTGPVFKGTISFHVDVSAAVSDRLQFRETAGVRVEGAR